MSQDAALIACVCVIRSMKSVGSRCVHATAVQGLHRRIVLRQNSWGQPPTARMSGLGLAAQESTLTLTQDSPEPSTQRKDKSANRRARKKTSTHGQNPRHSAENLIWPQFRKKHCPVRKKMQILTSSCRMRLLRINWTAPEACIHFSFHRPPHNHRWHNSNVCKKYFGATMTNELTRAGARKAVAFQIPRTIPVFIAIFSLHRHCVHRTKCWNLGFHSHSQAQRRQ